MLFKTLFIVLLYNYINAEEPGLPDILPRILYGEEVRIEDHPYFAGLINCGAAIISDRYLLTAGHCVAQPWIMQFATYAYVGGETIQNSQMVYYDKVILHENYHLIQGIPFNDIAVIRLARPLKFSSKIQPLKLPRQDSTKSFLTFVGRGNGEDGQATKQLLKMDVQRLSPSECISLVPPQYSHYIYQFKDILSKINVCAKRTNNMPGICSGDSGSPLTDGNVVVGLASYGGENCHANRLGFYVNVAYYADWVRKVTGLQ
ncbi:unnamed protein product [Colias eurytheme]|nr:unnamed protein product [Colias eurytheme]